MTEGTRPAFYALPGSGWRDYVTLLHAPYTAWHLSYVVLGACLAPRVDWVPLVLALAAFFLAIGIAAHALDELHGRPLRTRIPSPVLVGLAGGSLAGAAAIGAYAAVEYHLALLGFVVAGAFLVVAYNLELAGGRLHGDATFAAAWGAFPVLASYFVQTGRIRAEALAGAAAAALLSLAQRRLSTAARKLRRRVEAVRGDLELRGGEREPLSRESLLAPLEGALRTLTAATVALAGALLLFRLA